MACYFACGTRPNKISWASLVILVILGGIILSSGVSLVFQDLRKCSDRKQMDYKLQNNRTLPLGTAQDLCREQANKNPNSVWSNTSRGLVLLGFLILIILAPIPCYYFCCCAKPPDPMAVPHAAYPVAPYVNTGTPVMGTLAGNGMGGMTGATPVPGGGMAGLANGLVTTGGMTAGSAHMGPQGPAQYVNLPVSTGEPVTGVQVQPGQSANGHYGQYSGGGMGRDMGQGMAPGTVQRASAGYGGHYPEGGAAYALPSQPYPQQAAYQNDSQSHPQAHAQGHPQAFPQGQTQSQSQSQYYGGVYIANSPGEPAVGVSHGVHLSPIHQQGYLQGLPVDDEDENAYYRAGPNPMISVMAGNSGGNNQSSGGLVQAGQGERDWYGAGSGVGSADGGDSARTSRMGHMEVSGMHDGGVGGVEMGPYKGGSK